jgi:hypothetical protein
MRSNLTSVEWPELTFADWEKTCDTVHMWSQIVGKTRMAFETLQNHWWNVALYVTPVGLTTSAMPYRESTIAVDFDFVLHRLILRTSHGREHVIRLYARSVADFYAEYMASLAMFGIDLKIDRTPAEFDDSTPYDMDEHHASYDRASVEKFHQILTASDRVLKKFRARFIGKSSPVHFFWGSFDLAVTRFSGRLAPENPAADAITREGYSHEVSSCGFWPGDRRFPHMAYYGYAAPSPQGLSSYKNWDSQLGEFILRYDDARTAVSPEASILDFCQSTYEAAADLAHWDRRALERNTGTSK